MVTPAEYEVVDCYADGATNRERGRVVLGDLVETELFAVGGLQLDTTRVDTLVVDNNPVDTREPCVLEPVLYIELDARVGVAQTPVRVNYSGVKWFERRSLSSAARGHRPLAGSVDGVQRL